MLPYAYSPARPTVTAVTSDTAPMGGQVTAGYTGVVDGAVLMSPAAVTHQVCVWGGWGAARLDGKVFGFGVGG